MKRLFSAFMILVLCLGMLSVYAMAQENGPTEAAVSLAEIRLVEEEVIPAVEEIVPEEAAPAAEEVAPAAEEVAPAAEEIIPAEDAAANVAVDSVNFPDDAFRAFVAGYDGDSDGYLTTAELSAVKTMNCEGLGIADLTGVEHFQWLTELLCGLNELSVLDVSSLTDLDWLSVNNNLLTKLTLPVGGVLARLDCSNNALTKLRLSGLTELMQLSCHGNSLESIDLSGNPVLVSRLDSAVPMTEEGIVCHIQQNASYPVVLTCDENVTLLGLGVAVDATNFPDEAFRSYINSYRDKNHNGYLSERELQDVVVMNCEGLGIKELTGVAYFTNMTVLLCGLNELTELDVSMLPALDWVGVNGNALTSLTLPESGTLLRLDCSDNALTTLDISGQTGLVQLACHGNDLTTLDITQNTALLELVESIEPIAEEGILCYLVPGASYPTALTCDEDVTIQRIWMRLGDVTGDGLVTEEDAQELLNYANGLESVFGSTDNETWENARLRAADVLPDSRYDVRDAAQILRYEGGLASMIE